MTETTSTTMPDPQPLKRCAILGTAQSLHMAPWSDKTLECWGLNDGYMLNVPRADRWFDLHPWHQMWFRQAGPNGAALSSGLRDLPAGLYLRPEHHLQWLKTRSFPVYLAEAHPDVVSGRVFPKQQVLDFFAPYWPWRRTRQGQIIPGPDYEVSTPSWMLMLAMMEGYREIHVYGIHLATDWEYVQQRPNFEWLLGFAAGRDIKVVLPETTPICKASYRYAFEPKADIPMQQAQLRIGQIKQEGADLQKRLAALPWYAHGEKRDLIARLRRLDVLLTDARNTLGRLQALAVA